MLDLCIGACMLINEPLDLHAGANTKVKHLVENQLF